MAYRLRLDGVNDNVTIVSGINGNVGTQTYSYRVKGILNALPTVAGTPGAFGFIGTTATGQGNGICVYSTGAVGLVSGNTPRYGTSAGFLSVGVPFDFTISHISTGAWTITDNITTTVVASGTFTASTSWSGSLNNIGRLNSSTVHYLNADIEFIEVTGHTNARTWDANLSNGTGNTLPTTVGTNNGTLVNFTTVDVDKWINYGGVPEYTVNITGTYAGYTASVVADATEPVFTLSVAASYASYIAAVNSTNTKPVKTASVVSTYPSYTASVSATGGVSTYTVSVNTTYPKYTANVAVADVNKLSISTSYPAYTSNVTSTNIKPIKTASIVGTYAKYTASVVATKFLNETAVTVNSTYPSYSVSSVLTNVDPIRSVSVNAAYPNYSAAFVVTNVDPIKSLSINSTYPKYSASVNAGTLIQDRTLVINSTYPTYIASAVLGEFASLPNIGGRGAHLVISLGSRDVIIKDKSRNVKWRVENARL